MADRASTRTPAGPVRFLLRLPGDVHQAVLRAATREGLSVNEYCVRRLAATTSPHAVHPDARGLVARAEQIAPGHLVGIVLHGSWPRGEARTTSDVDVLVVLDASVPLTRALYQQWDLTPATWDGRLVDAHFIHLPADSSHAGAAWCEAAVEGHVLVDPDGRISKVLCDVRGAIADGQLVRKRAHGQPYWTRVA